jgi:hypothetical protein
MSLIFVLDNFHTNINLDVSGYLFGESYTIDASADAVWEVSTDKVKEAFQFQSDASDVIDASGSDIKFYLNETKFWDAGFKYNAADSQIVPGVGTPGPIGSGYNANKSKVCHDFVRYIAKSLFNTEHAVDLLDNELELLENIREKSVAVWDNMQAEMNKYNDEDGTGDAGVTLLTDGSSKKYSTNDNTGSIVRKLYEQMINIPAGRTRFNVVTGLRQDLPFEHGDQIEIKLTINAESNQHTLTGVSPLGGRSYRIIYKLSANPTNEDRAADESVDHLSKP